MIYRITSKSISDTGTIIVNIPSPGLPATDESIVIVMIHVTDTARAPSTAVPFLSINPVLFDSGPGLALIPQNQERNVNVPAMGMDWPRNMREPFGDEEYALSGPPGTGVQIIYDNNVDVGNVTMTVWYRVA